MLLRYSLIGENKISDNINLISNAAELSANSVAIKTIKFKVI